MLSVGGGGAGGTITGGTIWFTGLSGSGKSSVAAELERMLVGRGQPVCVLDGDALRLGLNADLGFTAADRDENIRRVSHVARLMADAGLVALVPVISPYREARMLARQLHEEAGLRFAEVYVDVPLDVCEQRDPKGLYARARAGEIKGFTGVDDPYEPPRSPEVHLLPADGDPAQQAAKVLDCWLT